MKELINWEDFSQSVNRVTAAAVYFYNPDCATCQAFSSQVLDLEQRYPEVSWLKADTLAQPTIAAQNLVFSVPVIVVFHNGREIFRQGRFLDKEQIELALAESLGG